MAAPVDHCAMSQSTSVHQDIFGDDRQHVGLAIARKGRTRCLVTVNAATNVSAHSTYDPISGEDVGQVLLFTTLSAMLRRKIQAASYLYL
jgi:hypothetical protein